VPETSPYSGAVQVACGKLAALLRCSLRRKRAAMHSPDAAVGISEGGNAVADAYASACNA